MNGEFALLTEKEAMWAEMLAEVLRDNEIPCTSIPVHGAGFSMRTGTPERLRIYVPEDRLDQARELMAALFPEDEKQE
ncbi:MAG: putative signal transducing protein [Clostridia bacterium]